MISRTILCLLLLTAPVPADAGTVFSTLVPDLPLMDGLQELADQGFAFDQPQGRVVETMAYGDQRSLSPDGIRRFYDSALPSLGWRSAGAGRYIRGQETLTIRIRAERDASIAEFLIEPRS